MRIENGEVTLEGTVKTRHEKRLAEDAVEHLSGVKDVHNHLKVESGEHNGRDRQQSTQGSSGSTGTSGARRARPPVAASSGEREPQRRPRSQRPRSSLRTNEEHPGRGLMTLRPGLL